MARIRLSDLPRGFSYAFTGVRILRKYPGLARLWVVPILLTLLSLVASVVLSIRYHDDLLALLWQAPVGEGFVQLLLQGLYWLLRAIAFCITLGSLVLVCIVLSMLAAAPFNDALSEAIEIRETNRTGQPFSLAEVLRGVWRTLRIETVKLLWFAAIMLPLALLSLFVPGIGQAVYAVVGTLFTVAYFAFDYTDWPASRRGLGFRSRMRLFLQRPGLMLGFGAAVWLCLFVPLLNVAFMPIAVAGGTRLFLDLESEPQS